MFIEIVTFLFLIGSVVAQDCPHRTTERVPTEITVGPMVECSETKIVVDGVSIGGASHGCPSVIVVVPAHLKPRHEPGCMTRTVPAGLVDITKIFYECKYSYLLFIKLSSECVLIDRVTAGRLTSYAAVPCTPIATNELGTID
jgi:hypothetical protein